MTINDNFPLMKTHDTLQQKLRLEREIKN